MFRTIIAALFAALFLNIAVVSQTTSVVRGRTETIRGTVQLEVIENLEARSYISRFFIQQCDGAPCDIAALRERERVTQTLHHVDEKYIYLSGQNHQFFANLHGREVILSGALVNEKVSRGKGNRIPAQSAQGLFNVDGVQEVFEKKIGPGLEAPLAPSFAPFIVAAPTAGQHQGVAFVATHPFVAPTSYTPATLTSFLFAGSNSARNWFEYISGYVPGRRGFSINGFVTREYTINTNQPAANCAQLIGNEWRVDIDNQGEAEGISKWDKQLRIYLFSGMTDCDFSAGATVRTLGDSGAITAVFMQLPTSGSQAALNSKFKTLIHELEHALGIAGHANGQQCEGCTIEDTIDNGDPMGATSIVPLNNVINFFKLGFNQRQKMYPAMETRGTYQIRLHSIAKTLALPRTRNYAVAAFVPLRDMAGNLTGKALVISGARPRATETDVMDVFGSDVLAYTKGPSLHLVDLDLASSFTSSIIQDATPGTSCCKDAPLVPDASGFAAWASSLYGVTVTAGIPFNNISDITVNLGSNYPVASNPLFLSDEIIRRQ